MSKLCIDLPPIAPDYSGAASALFDLGGIVVMHDASGCTGNYTGFDEPRWLGSRSAVYCSGLRRMDAIMGNDKKFIDGAVAAARDLDPTLIAYLGSPVPMVIGIDLDGMAVETEQESKIPSLGFNTTGQHYYDKGASDAFLKLIKRFAKAPEKAAHTEKRVNVLGLLSIDMGNEKNPEDICACIEQAGYTIHSRFAMGLSIEQIERVADADLNIVISRCGLDTAQYLERKYQIPYVCAAPVADGARFVEHLQEAWEKKVCKKETINPPLQKELTEQPEKSGGILILHEQVFANSIREEMEKRSGISVTVGSMYQLDARIARTGDLDLPHELAVRTEVNSGKYSVILADPEIARVIRREDVTLLGLPHVALSGRLYLDRYPSYLGTEMDTLINRAVDLARG